MTTSPANISEHLQWLFNGAPGKVVVFHQPQIAFQPVCHVKTKGKITTTYSIKDNNTFHKIRTTNDNLSLFVIKHIDSINYIVGTEKASAYRNNDGYPQTNLTVTPTLLVAGDKMVSAGSVVSLFNKSELLKYVINNYPNTELVKSDLSLEDVHDINRSLFKTFAPEVDYEKLTWKTEKTEKEVQRQKQQLQVDETLREAIEKAAGEFVDDEDVVMS